MPLRKASTRVAPLERATKNELRRQVHAFADGAFTRLLIDAIPSCLTILNRHLQVVYANEALTRLVGKPGEALYGLRIGEVLHCLNASYNDTGCGTAEGCHSCNAVLAMLAGKKAVEECSIMHSASGTTEILDLRVEATPFEYRGELFTVFAFSDISHERRRRALEQVFFHDVLNLLGSIKGLSEILRDYDPQDRKALVDMVHVAAEQTIDEILGQRTLCAAESGTLKLNAEALSPATFLMRLIGVYRGNEVAQGRTLALADGIPCDMFVSDRTLLGRVLGNLIKNALEASRPGETVTVGAEMTGQEVEFWVHNPGVISHEVQQQIFKRPFSTKGKGRGLGTYSVKLLSDLLGGSVSFTSSEEAGTIFRARYPLTIV